MATVEKRESLSADDTLAADGAQEHVDDHTINLTPRPLAASTVVRNGRKSDRFLFDGVQESFLEENTSANLPRNPARKSLSAKLDTANPNSSGKRIPRIPDFHNDSLMSDRSSLGLLPSDAMGDLSASLIHMSMSPQKRPAATAAPVRVSDSLAPVPEPQKSITSAADSTIGTNQGTSLWLSGSEHPKDDQKSWQPYQDTPRPGTLEGTALQCRASYLTDQNDSLFGPDYTQEEQERRQECAGFDTRSNISGDSVRSQTFPWKNDSMQNTFSAEVTTPQIARSKTQGQIGGQGRIAGQGQVQGQARNPLQGLATAQGQRGQVQGQIQGHGLTQGRPAGQTDQGHFQGQPRGQIQGHSMSQGQPGGQARGPFSGIDCDLVPRVEIAGGGGMVFNGQADMDASVVEVEINEDELLQFDEEFSDIGDLDTTLADETAPAVCDLRSELLLAEKSMREDEQGAGAEDMESSLYMGNPSFLASVDLNMTPSFLKLPRKPQPTQQLPDPSPDSAAENSAETIHDESAQQEEGSCLDEKYFRRTSNVRGDYTNFSPFGVDASINFAASTRIPSTPGSAPLTTLSQSQEAALETPNNVSSGHALSKSDLFSTAPTDHFSTAPLHSKISSKTVTPQLPAESNFSRSPVSHQGSSLTLTPGREGEHHSLTPSTVFSPNDSGMGAGLLSDGAQDIPASHPFSKYRDEGSQREKDWGEIFASQGKPAAVRQIRNEVTQRRESIKSSDIDTDDEIAAVRMEMSARDEAETRRQRGVGSRNADSHGSRPGLDGGSSEENDTPSVQRQRNPRHEVRDSAEGDFMASPMMGDGGGGGDGSSGHGSDDNSTPVAPHGGHVGSQTTMDVLRGLGFSGMFQLMSANQRANTYPRPPFEEDNPEAQQRIRPMGDDLLSSQRHVRFASPTDLRARTMRPTPGADDSANSPANLTPQDDFGASSIQDNSPFASMYLVPSAMPTNSMFATNGLDQSSFNLTAAMQQSLMFENSRGGANDSSRAANESRGGANLSRGAANESRGGANLSRGGASNWDPGDGQEEQGDAPSQMVGEDETDALDFTFSRKVSFGVGGDLSQLAPSYSPMSERSSTGGAASNAKDTSLQAAHDSFTSESTTKGEQASRPSVDWGQGITDQTFLEMEKAALDASNYNASMMGGFGTADGFNFNEEEFISADQANAMMVEDERELDQENIFMQADDLPDESSASLGFRDSWAYNSMMDITKPPWMADSIRQDTPKERVSIGTFMESRSAALGSLSSDPYRSRPSFGTASLTSPPQQPPVPLLQAPCLSDIQEQDSRVSDEVRGSGVGSDIDTEVADTTLQANDLVGDPSSTPAPRHRPPRSKSPRLSEASSVASNNSLLASITHPSSHSTPNTSYDSTDVSKINISDITSLISSTATTARPEELAGMIMMMSTAKLKQKKPSKPQTKGSQSEEDESSNQQKSLSGKDRRPDGKPDLSRPPRLPPASSPRGPSCSQIEEEVTSPDVMACSDDSRASLNRTRPSPPPLNGHTKIPLYKWNESPEKKIPKEAEKKPRRTQSPSLIGQQGRALVPRRSKSPALNRSIESRKVANEQIIEGDKGSEKGGSKAKTSGKPDLMKDTEEAQSRGGLSSRKRDEVLGDDSISNLNVSGKSIKPSQPEQDARSDTDETNITHEMSHKWKSPRPSLLMFRARRDDTFGESIAWETSVDQTNQIDETQDQRSTPIKRPAAYKSLDRDTDVSSQGDLQLKSLQKPVECRQHHLHPDTTRQHYLHPDTTNTSMSSQSGIPTLLTNQSLLETPFAQQYLTKTKSSSSVSSNNDQSKKPQSKTQQKLPLQSKPVISDRGNVADQSTTHTKAKPHSVSLISDQLNEFSIHHPNDTHSDSLISDQWSPNQNRRQATKENQPPDKAHQGGRSWLHTPRQVETFPHPRAPQLLNSNHSNSSPGYPSDRQKNNDQDRSDMSSPRSITGRANVSQVMVETPMDLRVEEVCCIGLSVQATLPLRNPTDRWLQVALRVVTLEIDGKGYDPDRAMPFVMKEKIIVEPRTTEDVKVIFSPRADGVHIAQLHVIASPVWSDQPVDTSTIPSMVTLQAVAERPNIEVLTEENRLDFGALPWGCQKSVHLFLLNHGQATIPVRLALASNKSSSQYFTFEAPGRVSGDSSIISLTRPPPFASLAPSVLNLTVPGATWTTGEPTKPLPVTVYFRAPQAHPDRGPVLGPLEEFSARLDVELDTPSSQIIIASLPVNAAAGTVRLHAPRDMEVVQFSCCVGSSQSRVVPLRNAGNIPIEVIMEVTHWPDLFTVQPASARVNPGHQKDVLVQFTPTHAAAQRFDSLLLMFVEPGGSGYEISLCGVTEFPTHRPPPTLPAPTRSLPAPIPTPLPTPLSTPRLQGSVIMSNKHFLAWGGVPLGRALQQSVTIQNNCDEHLRLRLLIRGHAHTFQLQSTFSGQRQGAEGKELVLQPREEYNIHVLFAPTSIAHFKGKLQLKPVHGTSKYSIPLSGYGGTSSLVWEGVEQGQSGSFWTNLGPLSPTTPAVVKTTVRNTGTRMAYVKALAFRDLGCHERLLEAQVLIQPAAFCLQPDATQEIAVVVKSTEREVSMCLDQANIIATVALFYGDEVSRQKYRVSLNRNEGLGAFKLSDGNPVKGINFNTYLAGEEQFEEGRANSETPNDIELFYSTMTKVTMACIGEPAKQDSPDIVKSTSIIHKEKLSSYNKDISVVADTSMFNKGPHPEPSDWYIKPEQVILSASAKDSDVSMKRVQLVNNSELPLLFELLWPGRVLTVSPDQGSVPPRSSAFLCVNVNSSLYTKGVPLPWRGQILIDAQGNSKVVKVQVREGATSDDSPQPVLPLPLPLLAEPGTPLVTMTSQTPPLDTDVLKLSHKTVHFPDTTTHCSTELSLDITNVSAYTVKWYISLFAPPYVKDSDAAVCRAIYTVFKFPQHYGVLGPGQQTKAAVTFSPRDAGHYSQFWTLKADIQGHPNQGQSTSSLTKVELLGQGVFESSPPAPDSCRQSNTTTLSSMTQDLIKSAKSDCLAEISPSLLEFPTLRPGESYAMKVQLKNRDTQDCCFHVCAPREPFRTKFSSIKVRSRHYVRWQISFRPTEPGTYHGVVILKTDNGTTLSVQLAGSCKL